MSRSKVKVTRDKGTMHSRHPPAATEWNAFAANNVTHQQTIPSLLGVISAACVRSALVKHL